MKVSGDWLENPGTQALFDVYEAHGFDLFVVGGCVRNALLGRAVTDIDLSSNARPETAQAFLESAGFRVIPTGFDHGILTVISDGVPHEITTFRKDVDTDGRRAVVAFSDDISEDAMRRDFTINALYAMRSGKVIDPLNGLADIDGPRLRFIGVADDRIREDYLRSLRFFRFHAQYVPLGAGFDPDALDAIARNLDGLNALSRERVGSELLKLLGTPDPGESLGAMMQSGTLTAILPGADPRNIGPLVHLEHVAGLGSDAVLRLAALCDVDAAQTLRMKKADLKRLKNLRHTAMEISSPAAIGYRLREDALSALALRWALLESAIPVGAIQEIATGQAATFPVMSKDLMPTFKGARLGEELRKLEAVWIESGFSLTRDQLLA